MLYWTPRIVRSPIIAMELRLRRTPLTVRRDHYSCISVNGLMASLTLGYLRTLRTWCPKNPLNLITGEYGNNPIRWILVAVILVAVILVAVILVAVILVKLLQLRERTHWVVLLLLQVQLELPQYGLQLP